MSSEETTSGPATTAAKSAATANKWIREINKVLSSKEYKEFTEQGDKIVKTYKNASSYSSGREKTSARVMYNILWANVQVMKPTLYARMPKVVVERRHKDMDPVARLASQICERATGFMISTQQDSYNYANKSAVEDRLLPGRGMVWLRYDADFESVQNPDTEEAEDIEDGDLEIEQIVKPNSEKVNVDYVPWRDYLESPSRTPYEVRWKARRSFLSKLKLKSRFGEEIAECCEASRSEAADSMSNDESKNYGTQAEVWEIWDKETRKVYFVCLEYTDACLDIVDDPLRLDDFFPCPYPLLATTTTDSQWPTADFNIYGRLAEELEYVTKRISAMAECIRLVGATASMFHNDVKNMLQLSDGQLWPIENWTSFVERSGLKGAIDWLPFDQCVAALGPLQAYQDKLLAQIWEITGIPDVVRGASDPQETAAAQQLKSHWVTIKVSEKQADVQRFVRETISKMAEIIFEEGLFSDETIYLMAGVQQMSPEDQAMAPQALQLLRSDRLRTFRVDIETDSTIAAEDDLNKGAWAEYFEVINQLMGSVQNVSQFRPELMAPMLEAAKAAVRTLRSGRAVEGAFDMAIQKIEDNDKAAAENPQPPPPDPAIIQAQAYAQDIQAKNQLKQLEMQNHAMEMQASQQVDMQKLQFQAQELQQKATEAQMRYDVDMQKIQLESAKVMNKKEMDQLMTQLDQFKAQFTAEAEKQRVEIEQYRVAMSAREELIEEARLKQQEMVDLMKASSSQESATPVINIHNGSGSKAITLQRAADGSLVGVAREMEG